MSKVYWIVVGILTILGGFGASLYLASLPEWFGWGKDDLRTILSCLMAVFVFAITPVGGGFIIYHGVTNSGGKGATL